VKRRKLKNQRIEKFKECDYNVTIKRKDDKNMETMHRFLNAPEIIHFKKSI
jgi:hypothetical protein